MAPVIARVEEEAGMRRRFAVLRRVGWAAFLAAIGAASMGAEASFAASGWVPPEYLGPDRATSPSRPQISLDAQGNAIAVWSRRGSGASRDMTVQTAFRPAGGPWQAPVDLSRPGPDGVQTDIERSGPQVAIDGQGNAVAVWQRNDGTSIVVQAAERPAGGAWRAPVDISGASASGGDSRSPQIVIDPSGTALAVWVQRNPLTGGYQLRSAERPAGGTWQEPIAASAIDEASSVAPRMVIDARGMALAVWLRNTGGATQPHIVSTTHPVGGAWQTPELVPDPALTPYDLDLAVDPVGNAAVSWSDFSGPAKAALRPATGGWETPVVLGTSGNGPRVAMDSAGNATVVFVDGRDAVRSRSHPYGGEWQPDVRINPGGQAPFLPSLVVDARGNALAAWSEATAPNSSIVTARRDGGEWQPPVRLTGFEQSAFEPDVAADPSGNAVVAWDDSSDGAIGAAGYDATPPEFRALTVPSSGVAGMPLTFSATPFDIWSAPLATAWSFGDGTTATATAVTHTYTVAGKRTVIVATRDLVGNSVGGTKAILIRPSVLGLRVSPNAFRRKRPGALSFRLAAPSTVRFGVERVRIGRRVGKRCVTATRANRRRAACTRYVRAGSFTRSRPRGGTRFKLPTSIGGRRLAVGRYRLSGTPRAAGLSGKPSRTGFRITG
jgi:hypothetical protein